MTITEPISDEFHEAITLPGTFLDYIAGTEATDLESDDAGCRDLAAALEEAPRRKAGRGYCKRVALSHRALLIVRDYAYDLADTSGADYSPGWPAAGRTVLDRVRVALAEWD